MTFIVRMSLEFSAGIGREETSEDLQLELGIEKAKQVLAQIYN